MGKFKLKFCDENGDATALELGSEVTKFFGLAPSPRKIYCGLFVLRRLMQNGAFHSAHIFLKGTLNTLFGKKTVLGNEEYAKLFEDTLQPGIKEPGYLSIEAPVGMRFYYHERFDLKELQLLLFSIICTNQYNLTANSIKGKTVIDAGANVGVFSVYAARLGAKKVYAFEPVKKTYLLLKRNIRANRLGNIVVPVNLALGRKTGSGAISYRYVGDGGASLEFLDRWPKVQKVRIISIDEFMENRGAVHFIKMDVEGYEEKVLLGARKTIIKHKPALSFSAYHKPDDKQRLPEVVKSIRVDYACVLHKKWEEDFFCR